MMIKKLTHKFFVFIKLLITIYTKDTNSEMFVTSY